MGQVEAVTASAEYASSPETTPPTDREVIKQFLEDGVRDKIFRPVYDSQSQPNLLGAFCPDRPRNLCYLSVDGDLAATFESGDYQIINEGDTSLQPYVVDLSLGTIAYSLSGLSREKNASIELSTSPTLNHDQSSTIFQKVANAFKNRRFLADNHAHQVVEIFTK